MRWTENQPGSETTDLRSWIIKSAGEPLLCGSISTQGYVQSIGSLMPQSTLPILNESRAWPLAEASAGEPGDRPAEHLDDPADPLVDLRPDLKSLPTKHLADGLEQSGPNSRASGEPKSLRTGRAPPAGSSAARRWT